MPTLRVRAFAKINLGLRVLGSRPDGYHEIRTVYQAISLADRIEVNLSSRSARSGTEITVESDDPAVPGGPQNLVYRACQRWSEVRGLRRGIVVRIEKRIPAASGLGGASSDAAGVLVALESLTGDRLDSASRLELAAELGSDVPFFLEGGRAFGCGRGEEVYRLPDLPGRHCLVIFPGFSQSTREAYAALDLVWCPAQLLGTPSPPAPLPQRGEGSSFHATESSSHETRSSNHVTESSNRVTESSKRFSPRPLGGEGPGVRGLSTAQVAERPQKGRPKVPPLSNSQLTARQSPCSMYSFGKWPQFPWECWEAAENDFERVVFAKWPELQELKRQLLRAGAEMASLSGSGSAVYAIFASARKLVSSRKMVSASWRSFATRTLSRADYHRLRFES
jgi:4-diphosphocytidyl-2-C-methyl-D-erythritol kinase